MSTHLSIDAAAMESTTGFTSILEHLLTYPASYDIPLRAVFQMNVNTQNPQYQRHASSIIPGNAFPRTTKEQEQLHSLDTQTAAAQLKASLIQHMSQLPSQPSSLPPSFITTFVRRCFPPELDKVDFPQALTALDYLKDVEVRRRREVVAALDKLGVPREDIGHREKLAKKYPGVLRWVVSTEEKEKRVEQLYTQVYIGLRRWTLINELSLQPLNKANCFAMLNTLYPAPGLSSGQFVQPTQQLTPTVLSQQRTGFLRYINAVEKNGSGVLTSLMDQHRREGETTGWPQLRETVDSYLRMANSIIDECLEITGHGTSPTAASFTSMECDEDGRRKVDSGISFGSSASSNRNSGQSHHTRPSTSSSYSTHSRKASKEKQNYSATEDRDVTPKAAGSTLERIARELRKIKSRGNMREQSRPGTNSVDNDIVMKDDGQEPPPTPSRERTLRLKRSLKKMRSNGTLRDASSSRPTSQADEYGASDVPAFDAEEMRRRRELWEASQRAHHRDGSGHTVESTRS
jgi:hypothetical protein